jgi:hypothetical protein
MKCRALVGWLPVGGIAPFRQSFGVPTGERKAESKSCQRHRILTSSTELVLYRWQLGPVGQSRTDVPIFQVDSISELKSGMMASFPAGPLAGGSLSRGSRFGGRQSRIPVPAPRNKIAGESRGSGHLLSPRDTVHPFSDPRLILRMSIVEDTTLLVGKYRISNVIVQFVVPRQPLLGCCPKEGRRRRRNPFPAQTLSKSSQAMDASAKVRGFEESVLFWDRGRDFIRRIGSHCASQIRKLE